VINQLLRQVLDNEKAPRSFGGGTERAWLIGGALLGGLAGFLVRCPWRLLTSLALLALIAIGLGFWVFLDRTWMPVVAPLGASLLSAILVNARAGNQEQRDRKQLMSLFARNLSPAVAESLWEQRQAFSKNNRPKPQELTVTVIFTDLAGFSTVSEGMSPPELMDWLNEYMEIMARQVESNGGVVMKYIGDSIMGVFGVPLPRTCETEIARDAANAVRAALGMQSELAALNARWRQTGRQCAQMRAGIFTGPVIAGCLGSASRLEYTTLGDTVNTASRLESWAKEYNDPELPVGDCRILIGESTHALIADQFRTSRVGEIKLKGKERPTTIHRVLGNT
jgi:adenylate cyclase